METDLTKKIKKELLKRTYSKLGYYGAFEVTNGYDAGVKGYERIDYVELNNDSEFTCYEIKISLSDFHSKNKLSWLGNKNYLVVTKDIAKQVKKEFDEYQVGIMSYDKNNKYHPFKVIKNARHKQMNVGQKTTLLEEFAKASARDAKKYWLGE